MLDEIVSSFIPPPRFTAGQYFEDMAKILFIFPADEQQLDRVRDVAYLPMRFLRKFMNRWIAAKAELEPRLSNGKTVELGKAGKMPEATFETVLNNPRTIGRLGDMEKMTVELLKREFDEVGRKATVKPSADADTKLRTSIVGEELTVLDVLLEAKTALQDLAQGILQFKGVLSKAKPPGSSFVEGGPTPSVPASPSQGNLPSVPASPSHGNLRGTGRKRRAKQRALALQQDSAASSASTQSPSQTEGQTPSDDPLPSSALEEGGGQDSDDPPASSTVELGAFGENSASAQLGSDHSTKTEPAFEFFAKIGSPSDLYKDLSAGIAKIGSPSAVYKDLSAKMGSPSYNDLSRGMWVLTGVLGCYALYREAKTGQWSKWFGCGRRRAAQSPEPDRVEVSVHTPPRPSGNLVPFIADNVERALEHSPFYPRSHGAPRGEWIHNNYGSLGSGEPRELPAGHNNYGSLGSGEPRELPAGGVDL